MLDRSGRIEKDDVAVFDFSGYGEDFGRMLRSQIRIRGTQNISNLLKSFSLPSRFIKLQLEHLGIDQSSRSSELNKKSIQSLIRGFSETPFRIYATGGFNMAMVTAGGIDTREIRSSTMESVIAENLFFAGEVIDIDGDTGGYNLQAAFSTAYLAGMNA